MLVVFFFFFVFFFDRLTEWQKQQLQAKKDKDERINKKIQILSAPEPKRVHVPMDEQFVADGESTMESVGDSVSEGFFFFSLFFFFPFYSKFLC
jgi:hypothetical protein